APSSPTTPRSPATRAHAAPASASSNAWRRRETRASARQQATPIGARRRRRRAHGGKRGGRASEPPGNLMGVAAHATTRAPGRTLTVRRPLVAPAVDRRRILQAMRRWLVRRTITLGLVLVGLCIVQVWLRLQVVDIGYQLSATRQMQE